jgi:FkbM family methyltransferase
MGRISQLVPQPVRSLAKKLLFQYRNRSFTPYATSFEKDGKSYQFYLGDRIGESWFKNGWDFGEVDYLRDHLVQPGDVIFECGAHHGENTILLSTWAGPSGTVVAFEPVPHNARTVQKQVELNGLENVQVINAAVGSARGTVRMTDESNAQVSRGPGIDVEVVRLDDFVHMNPTLLKIDVEGFEAELLRGAQEVLALRPKISLEVHTPSLPRYGTSVEEVMALVGEQHYDWTAQFPGEPETWPWDGDARGKRIHLFGIPR